MSKRRGTSGISLLLSALIDSCKKTVKRYSQVVSGKARPTSGSRQSDGFEHPRAVNVTRPSRMDFCGEGVELEEITRLLTVGDRIRVLCDDGVITAEKISETQFKLIDFQMMPKLVQ